jgi:hypothetical protein
VNNIEKILSIATAAFGVCLFIFFCGRIYLDKMTRRKGTRFTGRIVDNKEDKTVDLEYGTKSYHPIIEYKDGKGETKTFMSDIGSGVKYPLGQNIAVIEFHNRAIAEMPQERSILNIIGVIFGVVVFVVGLYNYLTTP